MRKRILSALLVLCMMLSFIPAVAPAANATTEQPRRRIMLGASGIANADTTNKKWDYVYFGSYNDKSVKWRVLSTNGNGGSYKNADGESVSADSALFLLSEEVLDYAKYSGDSEADWTGETAREWCNDLFSNATDEERAYILSTSKTEGMFYVTETTSFRENTIQDEKYFLLSAKEAVDYVGNENLNTTYATDGSPDRRGWWFRSRGVRNKEFGLSNQRTGYICVDMVLDTLTAGYRPAVCLDSSKILFISAPGNKLGNNYGSIEDYSGDTWKMTLLDSSRNDFSAYLYLFQGEARYNMGGTGEYSKEHYGLWVKYSGAKFGENDRISLIILDKDGNVKYYNNSINKPTSESDYACFWVPHDSYDRNSDRLFIFNESLNGDYAPDYSSPLIEVSIDNRFNLNLETNGGSIADGKDADSYISGQVTPLPTADDMTRADCLFTGWYTDADFSGEPLTEIGADISGDLTLFAKWELASEHKHTGTVKWVTGNTTHKKAWSCCGTVVEDETAHSWNGDNICTVCGYAKQHMHCICGGDLTVGDHKTHMEMTYIEWDGVSDIDYGAGRIARVALSANATLPSNLEINDGKTLYLCLNGKTIASDGTSKIILKGASRLILCDCQGGGIIKGAESGWGGAAVYIYNSTMYMYGGKITGGKITGKGGGGAITLDDQNCTFNMYGGEISDNYSARYGGAIYLYNGGTVNLHGGVIQNNSADWNGGAIYALNGKINISGNPVVKNNTTSGNANNIWLASGNTVSVKDMTEGAEIGITTASSEYPVVFSDARDTDYADYFFADNANAHVEYNKNNQLELAAGAPVPSHKHKWASEWTNNETHHWHECTADGCDLTDNSQKKGYGTHSGEDDGDCTTQLLCSECGYKITEKKDGHDFGEWESVGDGTHKAVCKNAGCGQTDVKNCFGGKATCSKKAICETCGTEYGNLDPDNHSGEAEWIKTSSTHMKKYNCCDVVADAEKAHTWENGACSECGYGCNHSGGKATCSKKAVCETCGKEYGSLDPDNHSDLRHIEAKAATKTAEGNIEYWYCSGCGRYFADRDRTKEITKADTVTAKLTEDEPLPPATGETISLTLLTALLFISSGAVTAVISRKRRHGR